MSKPAYLLPGSARTPAHWGPGRAARADKQRPEAHRYVGAGYGSGAD